MYLKEGQTMRKKNYLFVLFCFLALTAPGISYSQSAIDGFNPNANSYVSSIAVQTDGKILVGGGFTTMGGVTTRNRIARLTNTDAALQELTVASDGSQITWMRSQASPEVWRTVFEHSTDGAAWSSLGNGTRITGGWELTGLSLPWMQNHYVRARGYASGGYWNGSESVFESVRIFYLSTLYVCVSGDCGGRIPCYHSIQNAVDTAASGADIWIAGGTYPESITLNASKALTLKGNWNAGFTAQTSTTRLSQAPTAPNGSLTLQELNIKP